MNKKSTKKVKNIGETDVGKNAVARRKPLGDITSILNGTEKNAESKEKTTMAKKATRGTVANENKTENPKEFVVNNIISQESFTKKNNENARTRTATKNLHNKKPTNTEEPKSEEIDTVEFKSQKAPLRTSRRQAQATTDNDMKTSKNEGDSLKNLEETEHETQDKSQKAPMRSTRRKAQETLKKNDLPVEEDTHKSKLHTRDDMKTSKNQNSTKSKEVPNIANPVTLEKIERTKTTSKNLRNEKPTNIEDPECEQIEDPNTVEVESQKAPLRTTRRQAQATTDNDGKTSKNESDSLKNLEETEHETQDKSQKAPIRSTRRKAQETLKKNDLPVEEDTHKSKLHTRDDRKTSKNKNSTKSKEVPNITNLVTLEKIERTRTASKNLRNEKPTNIEDPESEQIEDPNMVEVESQKAQHRTTRKQAQETADDVKRSKSKGSTKSKVLVINLTKIEHENEQIEESQKVPLRTTKRRAQEPLKKNDLPITKDTHTDKPQTTDNDLKTNKNQNSTKSKNGKNLISLEKTEKDQEKSEKTLNTRTRNRSRTEERVKNTQKSQINKEPSTSRSRATNKNNVQSEPVEETNLAKNEEVLKVPLKSNVPNELPAAKNQIFKHKIVELDLGKDLKLPNQGSGNIGVSLFLNNQFKTDKGKKKKVVHPPTHHLVKTHLKNDPPKTLRSRNPVNYAEVTLNESNVHNMPTKSADDEKLPVYKRPLHEDHHNDEDEYEFDSDSEKPKKKRKKKEDSDDSSLYDKKMMRVLTNIASKIKKRKQENGKVNNVKFTLATDALERGELGVVVNNKTKPPQIAHTENLGVDVQAPSPDLCDNGTSDHEDVLDEQQEISRCFGFEELSPITKRRPNPIMVHQNVTIHTPQLFHKRRPTANSTMLESSNSPWRYNYNINRRPYFVRIKTSGLPAIQQEPVIDHTFDKTPPERPKDFEGLKKEPVQTSIIDYLPGTEHLRTNDKPQDLTLFDMHQFSPIKRKPVVASNTPRKVLGIRNDIVNAISTPIREAKSTIGSPDLSNIMQETNKEIELSYFGFANDSPDASLKSVNNDAKPSRFSLNTLKQYKRKPQLTREKSPVPESPEPNEAAEIEPEVPEENQDNSCEIVEVHLFEDLEKPDGDMTPKKSRKRTKYTVDPDELGAKRRKREKEDPELEKWAADMTAHFNEVEKFDLEIE